MICDVKKIVVVISLVFQCNVFCMMSSAAISAISAISAGPYAGESRRAYRFVHYGMSAPFACAKSSELKKAINAGISGYALVNGLLMYEIVRRAGTVEVFHNGQRCDGFLTS